MPEQNHDFEGLAKKFDKSVMRKLLDDFAEQAKTGLALAEKFDAKDFAGKKFGKVVFCGMGGSGIAGQVAKSVIEEKTGIPAFVVAGYSLPKFSDKDSLVVSLSYSGNTEETLSCAKQAREKGIPMLAITSGGRLAQLEKNSVIVPGGRPPRASTGYTLFALLACLEKIGVLPKSKELENAASFANANLEKFGSEGKKIAESLCGKIPVIYACECFEPVAFRWHTQFSENSKAFSHYAVLPELNHNELVGYRPFEEKLCFVFLRCETESPRIRERLELTKKIVAKKSHVEEVVCRGGSKLEMLLSLMLVGDYASYYLALLNGVDPTPVENIVFLKKSLHEKGFFED